MFGRRRHGRDHGGGGHGRGGHGRRRGWRAGRHRPADTTLDQVRPGEHVEIADVDDETARAQAIRLGISEGAPVTCVTKLPCGPVILKCGLQEIAVGRGLARRICVRRDERMSGNGAL
jgi:ferrous iron transport protein A